MCPQGPFFTLFDPKLGQNKSELGFRLFCIKGFHWINKNLFLTTFSKGVEYGDYISWRLPFFLIRKPYEIPLALDMHWLCRFPLGSPGGLKWAYGAQIFSDIRYMSPNTGLIFRSWHIWTYGDIQH